MEKIFSKKSVLAFFGWTSMTLACGIIAVLSGVYLYLSPTLPDVDTLREVELQTPLRVFSADGKVIGEFGEKRRNPITFSETPENLINAILAAEDDGFYSHNGVDIKGLLRAASQLLISGEIQTGGSTITMQVARNFFLSRNQTFSRKFNEILLAIRIENELSKEEILELYLNKIYLGNRAYGVKAAAQVYYGKPINELSLAQTAMIAGLPKAPSTYNPIINASRALVRRDWILGRLLSLGKIDKEAHEVAISEGVSATYHGQNLDLDAPYAAEIAREKILNLVGEEAYTQGYSVITTIDSRLQQAGQTAIINGLVSYDRRHGYRGAEKNFDIEKLQALVNPNTGEQNNTAITPIEKNISAVSSEQLGAVNLIPWVNELRKIPTYGGLKPAAIVSIKAKEFTAILGTGKAATVTWDNGISAAKRYIDENTTGRSPKQAGDVVKLGDVVRLSEDEDGNWQLSQIPDAQAALVALNPEDGGIRTIVGGFDFSQSSFNRATQAKRQPGSNFKPFIYAIGLESGLTPASIFNDAPVVIEDDRLENVWRPENSSGKFYGPTRMRKALYLSRNLVSIRLLRNLGIPKVSRNLKRFGISQEGLPKDLSLALGSHVMTPVELATGFSVFANQGKKIEPYLVAAILDNQGKVIFAETPFFTGNSGKNSSAQPNTSTSQINLPFNTNDKNTTDTSSNATTATGDNDAKAATSNKKQLSLETRPARQVLDKRVSYLMNSMLRDVVSRGTAQRAKTLKRNDLAGKTGTTNGPTDAWFSGFNQHIVTTTWLGYDNNKPIGRREFGGTAALPIWIEFMDTALAGIPEALPPQPNGIVRIRIDPETGERTSASNPNGISEMFLQEHTPSELTAEVDYSNGENVIPEDIF